MTTLQRVIKYCAVAFGVFLIVSIIGGICGAIGMASNLFGGSAVGEMQTFAVSGDVESLKIEISAADLEIVSGDAFSVESNHKYLTVREENGTLVISESKVLFGMSSNGVSVVLTVPEDFVFEEADVSAGAGRVVAETISANTLRLELGAGETDIGCLNAASEAKIDGGAGKLAIGGGELHDLRLSMGVGKLELTGWLTGDCSLDYGVGDAELVLLGSREDYKIKLDKGVGGAALNGETMRDDSVYGGGWNRINIDGGVGNLTIRFADEAKG